MTTSAKTAPDRRRAQPKPSPGAASSRERMIEATADLLQKQGYAGTGLREVLAASGAPRGSLYFHFPGGKEQLACEALAANGRHWLERLGDATRGVADPMAALDAVCAMLGEELERSDWELGCPIATVALEAAHTSDAIRQTCAAHFAELEATVIGMLARAGVPQELAPVAATFAISAIEGSMLLARVQRSRVPLDRVATALRAQLSAMLAMRA